MENVFSVDLNANNSIQYISDFFGDEDFALLFMRLSLLVSKAKGDLVVRGTERKIIGVSVLGQRYFFYVVPNDRQYIIKFRNGPRIAFSLENTRDLILLAQNEAELEKKQPKGFVVTDTFQTQDDEAFYKLYKVNVEQFRGIDITRDIFSTRAYNCLIRAGIDTFPTLLMLSETQLARVNQLGRTTCSEIISVIERTIKENSNRPISLEAETNNRLEADDKDTTETCLREPTRKEKGKTLCNNLFGLLLRAGDTETGGDANPDSSMEFYIKLEQWVSDFIDSFSTIEERKRKMFISRVVDGKSLSQIGNEHELSRERIRQICEKTSRRIKTIVNRNPNDAVVCFLEQLTAFFSAYTIEELKKHLVYALKHKRNVCVFVFSIIIPAEYQKELSDKFHEEQRTVIIEETQKEQKKPEKKPSLPPVKTGRLCPWCYSELVVRTAKRGIHSGHMFIGCSAFPRCRYKEQLSLKEGEALGIYKVIRKEENDSSD